MDEIKNVLRDAYFTQVNSLYNNFALAYTDAADDENAISEAEVRFTNGLDHAKKVYQRALALSLGFSG